ncbi:MAG: hypothetical protein QW607_10165 [Desulfurococcaceae archaeon]
MSMVSVEELKNLLETLNSRLKEMEEKLQGAIDTTELNNTIQHIRNLINLFKLEGEFTVYGGTVPYAIFSIPKSTVWVEISNDMTIKEVKELIKQRIIREIDRILVNTLTIVKNYMESLMKLINLEELRKLREQVLDLKLKLDP